MSSTCILFQYRINIGAMMTKLKKILATRQKGYIHDPSRIPSAVLIPIYEEQGEHYIVFIKRTDTVKTHKGQISYPGGGREKCDITLRDTAIREACEEIGLGPEDIEILGEMDDEITTTSNYIVTPFVGMIPWPYKFTIEKAEVAEIISVPLKALQDSNNLKTAIETLDGGIIVDSYEYHYKGKVIWGATARIQHKFLEIIAPITG
jgi:8-oxo-dGTP pyrophosphatase MutT (NUDIX family)